MDATAQRGSSFIKDRRGLAGTLTLEGARLQHFRDTGQEAPGWASLDNLDAWLGKTDLPTQKPKEALALEKKKSERRSVVEPQQRHPLAEAVRQFGNKRRAAQILGTLGTKE